jgi:DNA (cytosine-5)-methyltransferase 1
MGVEMGAAISLFSGAGGLDLGVEQAGFDVVSSVEVDRDAADTLEKNFHHLASEVIRRDIRKVSTREILRAGGIAYRDRPELLIGGCPCVAFSKSGFWLEWKRTGQDPAAELLSTFTRVLEEARPRAFILENVYALTYANHQSRPAFDRLLTDIANAGYRFTWGVLNAADYGVPQLRPRLFVVGARKREPMIRLPEPTHGGRWERQTTGRLDNPHVTAQQAFSGLNSESEPGEEVGGKWGHLLPEVPPGDNYLYFTARRGHPDPIFDWRSRYWTFLLKLHPDKPSSTIQAQPGTIVGPFHWDNRRLRVPEIKRLFSFPDSFDLVGQRTSQQKQLGNSVPPRLAEHVAMALAESLDGS